MKVVIIGAGTAGWSSAAALSYFDFLDIILVASTKNETIGVGESTTPLVKAFHSDFNIFSDLNWLYNSNGTLKFTIEFENFTKARNNKWSHPFYSNKIIDTKEIEDNLHIGNIELCEKLFYIQKMKNEKFYEIDEEYAKLGAFHFDSNLYMNELKKVAIKRGVKIIEGDVTKVSQKDSITEYIIVDEKQSINADLFIDCSGFNSTLFKNLETQYISFKDRLFNDTALIIRLPYQNEKKQKINSTLGYALKNGWVWHIPLNDSISYGYVHSSKHTSQEDAQNELKEYLSSQYGYSFSDFKTKKIEFNSGCYRNNWIGNNIAIGLSSFFIEPIESTGIALFQLQIIELGKILQNNPKFMHNFKNRYNETIFENIISVKNFVEMHYILSNRKDSQFWIDQSSILPNKFQEELIELYKNRDFNKLFQHGLGGIFGSYSWFLLFHGMDTKAEL